MVRALLGLLIALLLGLAPGLVLARLTSGDHPGAHVGRVGLAASGVALGSRLADLAPLPGEPGRPIVRAVPAARAPRLVARWRCQARDCTGVRQRLRPGRAHVVADAGH
ncbi:MAG: hypothetical protein KIT14_05045 [bacterium]|nr:hypothetical protein [bacterium]